MLNAKAMASKALTAWLADRAVAHALKDGATEADRMLAACIYAYQRMIDVMDACGMILSEEEALLFKNLTLQHLHAWSWLHQRGMATPFSKHDPGKRIFILLPKLHHLWHLGHDVYESKLNPKATQLMSAESFIGVVGRIGKACHRTTVQSRTLQRYVASVKFKVNKLL